MPTVEVLEVETRGRRLLLVTAIVGIVVILVVAGVQGWRHVREARETLGWAQVERSLKNLDTESDHSTVHVLEPSDFTNNGALLRVGDLDCSLAFPLVASSWHPGSTTGFLVRARPEPTYAVLTVIFESPDASAAALTSAQEAVGECAEHAVREPATGSEPSQNTYEADVSVSSDDELAYDVITTSRFTIRGNGKTQRHVTETHTAPIHVLRAGNTLSWQFRAKGDQHAPEDTRPLMDRLESELTTAMAN